MSNKCSNCGAENPEEALFCGQCGHSIKTIVVETHESKAVEEKPSGSYPNTTLNKPVYSRSKGLPRVMLLYFFTFLLCLLFLHFVTDGTKPVAIILKKKPHFKSTIIDLKTIEQRWEHAASKPWGRTADDDNMIRLHSILVGKNLLKGAAANSPTSRGSKRATPSSLKSNTKKDTDIPCEVMSLSSIGDVGTYVRQGEIPVSVVSIARSSDGVNSTVEVRGYAYDLDGDGVNEYFVINVDASGATHFVTDLFVLQSNEWKFARQISNPLVVPDSRNGEFVESYHSGSKWEGSDFRVPYRLSRGTLTQTGPPCTLK